MWWELVLSLWLWFFVAALLAMGTRHIWSHSREEEGLCPGSLISHFSFFLRQSVGTREWQSQNAITLGFAHPWSVKYLVMLRSSKQVTLPSPKSTGWENMPNVPADEGLWADRIQQSHPDLNCPSPFSSSTPPGTPWHVTAYNSDLGASGQLSSTLGYFHLGPTSNVCILLCHL